MKKQPSIHPAQACAISATLVACTKAVIREKVCTGDDRCHPALRVVYLDVVMREMDKLVESLVVEFANLHEGILKPKPRRKARGKGK